MDPRRTAMRAAWQALARTLLFSDDIASCLDSEGAEGGVYASIPLHSYQLLLLGPLVAPPLGRRSMRGIAILSLSALVAASVAAPSFATTISSLVGDKDGFGGQTVEAVPNGVDTGFNFNNTGGADPAFQDVWLYYQEGGGAVNPSFNHAYVLDGPASWATLFLNESGMGDDRGPWTVLFDGNNIGTIGGPTSGLGGSTALLLGFPIPVAFLTGNDTVQLLYDPSFDPHEGYAINFSELVIETVPEPGTALLLGGGLLGLVRYGRRRH
jgi:hypothetical protein